jgi:NodT family efflux transporter outer membrane factor (OMF) lipoprotein
MKRILLWPLAGLLMGACSLAPEYHTPEVPTAPRFKETPDWKLAQPNDAVARGAWWEAFQDQDLNQLENRVTESNQDIRAAFARLEQARATVQASQSFLFPSLDANASVTKARDSVNKPFLPSSVNPYYRDNVVGLSVSYELDVWGRLRNALSSTESRAAASAADLAVLDLGNHAELAKDYLTLRSYDAEQKLLEETVTAYRQALELTQHLFDGGAAAAADVALAKLQLQNAITLATDTRLKRAQIEHAIAVLVGETPSHFSIPARTSFVVAFPMVDAGLPSALLERRPDIAAAERRVAAANADIGVAKAAFFPVFGLGGMAGYESTSSSNWISAPSLFWSVGPSAALNLFDAGRRRALTQQARSAYEEAVAQYRQTVLLAYQEVEDNLAALRELERERQSASAANDAAQESLTQANSRYQGGAASYLEVVTAQTAALQAQLALIDIQSRHSIAAVQLVKALGGGWHGESISQN